MSAKDQMSKLLDQLMGQNRDGKLTECQDAILSPYVLRKVYVLVCVYCILLGCC